MFFNTPIDFATFGTAAIANGFAAFPIPPRSKKTRWENWNKWCHQPPRPSDAARWAKKYPNWSTAIACGATVFAVDIDELDEDRAQLLANLAMDKLGKTPLVRVGRWPKRLLVYRVDGRPFPTKRIGKVDVLGTGTYFLASGIHPDTKKPYQWRGPSPASFSLRDVPAVGIETFEAFLRMLGAFYGVMPVSPATPKLSDDRPAGLNLRPVALGPWQLDRGGLVVDGRDAFLARLVWDATRQTRSIQAAATAAWAEFQKRAELTRPRRQGSQPWSFNDALKKAQALHRSGKIGRPFTLSTEEHGFWTNATKYAFGLLVNEAGATRILSPATVQVSNAMLALVHGDGCCFASVATIADSLGLSMDTVKKAKRRLRQTGFWLSNLDQGGRGCIARYQPNPQALTRDFKTIADKATETVDVTGTRIIQAEGGNLWEDLLLEKKEISL